MSANPSAAEQPKLRRVCAGPGSGKTRQLIEEIRDRVKTGIAPETILALTFTTRAAKEMRERIGTSGRVPWMGTIHALAYRILNTLGALKKPVNVATLIPDAIVQLRAGAEVPWLLKVQYIAVDEAQDLDGSQVEMLQLLVEMTKAEVLLVGDPDQSIFGFRHASAEYLLHPELIFPHQVETVTLATNHRSAPAIVAAARALLSPSADPQSPCHTLTAVRTDTHPTIRWIREESPEAEAARIIEEVRTLIALGMAPNQIAILVRIRAQIPVLQAEAARWKIPVYTPPTRDKIGGEAEGPDTAPTTSIQVMTMHQSKGNEFDIVFIAGVQEGMMPYKLARTPKQQQEELRVLYVAVTRAKLLLWFCCHGAPSRFIVPLERAALAAQAASLAIAMAPTPVPTTAPAPLMTDGRRATVPVFRPIDKPNPNGGLWTRIKRLFGQQRVQ